MSEPLKDRDYRKARQEQESREKGKALGHYGRAVGKTLAAPRAKRKLTPSKKARR